MARFATMVKKCFSGNLDKFRRFGLRTPRQRIPFFRSPQRAPSLSIRIQRQRVPFFTHLNELQTCPSGFQNRKFLFSLTSTNFKPAHPGSKTENSLFRSPQRTRSLFIRIQRQRVPFFTHLNELEACSSGFKGNEFPFSLTSTSFKLVHSNSKAKSSALYEIEWVAEFIVQLSERMRNPTCRTRSRPY